MKSGPYQVIFILLISSVVAILVLQAFWLRNFYVQKHNEFDNKVYNALEQVTTKLRERVDRQTNPAKINYDPIFKKDQILSGKPKPLGVYSQVLSHYKQSSKFNAKGLKTFETDREEINVTDSVIKIFTGKEKSISQGNVAITADSGGEIEKLVDKMMLEVKIKDRDETDRDTLRNIIEKVFVNNGLFLPFEFEMKKIFNGVNTTLAKSVGYSERDKSFVSDLSANNVFSTHNFIFLQFPGEVVYVLGSIKKMLLLSMFFSLVMIGIFYYTIQLINRQRKLVEVRNDFVNNMTHELKTPIATNSLAIDALTNPLVEADEEKFNDYLRILKEENQKLGGHVERVSQIKLLDKGDLNLDKKSLNLVSLIMKLMEDYKLQINDRKATVTFDTLEKIIIINADEQHLQTVFSNLLDNALKYSDDRCVINIEIKQSEGKVRIHFKDKGIGIDKEHLEKIFDKFYRVQGGDLHDVKGFGLGLSYVKSIVEAHKGTIELKSNPGKGSEFIISLAI